MGRKQVITRGVLYLIGLVYAVGFTNLFASSLLSSNSSLIWLALVVGPFWEVLMLLPATLALAVLGARPYQFLLTLVSYQVVACITWYHVTGEWVNDVAEGGIPIVAIMMLGALISQVPIGITTIYVMRRLRRNSIDPSAVAPKIPRWAFVASIIFLVIIVAAPTVWVALVTWPHNLVAKAIYWAHPTPPPMPHSVRTVRYRPEALAVGQGHILLVSSDGPNWIATYRVLPNRDLVPWHVLAGARTGIRDPLGIALDKTGRLYVANYDTNTISRFKKDVSGNVAPEAIVQGSRTMLKNPSVVQVDDAGYLYVLQGVDKGEILVFPPEAFGNIKPSRVISGPHTLLAYSSPLHVDGHGRIFVGNRGPIGANSTDVDYVTVFAPSATGNVEPSTVLNFGNKGRSFTIDDTGRLILVSNDGEVIAYPQPYSESTNTNVGFVDKLYNVQGIAATGGLLYLTDLQTSKIFVYSLTGPSTLGKPERHRTI